MSSQPLPAYILLRHVRFYFWCFLFFLVFFLQAIILSIFFFFRNNLFTNSTLIFLHHLCCSFSYNSSFLSLLWARFSLLIPHFFSIFLFASTLRLLSGGCCFQFLFFRRCSLFIPSQPHPRPLSLSSFFTQCFILSPVPPHPTNLSFSSSLDLLLTSCFLCLYFLLVKFASPLLVLIFFSFSLIFPHLTLRFFFFFIFYSACGLSPRFHFLTLLPLHWSFVSFFLFFLYYFPALQQYLSSLCLFTKNYWI